MGFQVAPLPRIGCAGLGVQWTTRVRPSRYGGNRADNGTALCYLGIL
jgi:hypothetical protein